MSVTKDDRVELLEGEIVEMAPIGSPHQGTVDRLNRLFTSRLGERVIVRVQGPVLLASVESEPEPDVALLVPRPDFYTTGHPEPTDILLAVEVMDTSVEKDRRVKLPGEFLPYLSVPIHAKVSGFVEDVKVDRGSEVKKGQVLATLEAPEMTAHIVEAQAKVQAVELQRSEAEAKLAGVQSTYDHLKAASATPGVVAENDVTVAQKSVEAAQAFVRSYEGSIKAVQASVQALKDLAEVSPRLVTVVEMRYFGGVSELEIAEALGVTERTVRRDWEKARILLAAALK